jgi:uncharacterized membrane protein
LNPIVANNKKNKLSFSAIPSYTLIQMTEGGSGGGEIVAGGGETGRRAIVKAITYRVIVAITLAAISWFYTGNLFETSAVSITYTIIATIVYYVHERAWIKVKWGKAFHSKKNSRQ